MYCPPPHAPSPSLPRGPDVRTGGSLGPFGGEAHDLWRWIGGGGGGGGGSTGPCTSAGSVPLGGPLRQTQRGREGAAVLREAGPTAFHSPPPPHLCSGAPAHVPFADHSLGGSGREPPFAHKNDRPFPKGQGKWAWPAPRPPPSAGARAQGGLRPGTGSGPKRETTPCLSERSGGCGGPAPPPLAQ